MTIEGHPQVSSLLSCVLAVHLNSGVLDEAALSHAGRALPQRRDLNLFRFSKIARGAIVHLASSRTEAARSEIMRFGKAVQRTIYHEFQQTPWVGLSPLDRRTGSLGEQVARAFHLIQLGQRYWKEPRVVLPQDVLPIEVLDTEPKLLATSARILDPLIEYDSTHGTHLRATLAAYLEEHLSISRVARAQGIHRHTVQLRLKRISELLGFDFTNGHDRLLLELALVARQLKERRSR